MPLGSPFTGAEKVLDWSRSDIERRFGFKGGRFTAPSNLSTLIMGVLLTSLFYTCLVLVQQKWPETHWFAAMFLERGPCPYPTMFLFFWAVSMLWIKWRKLKLQRRALGLPVMPQDPEFVLTSTSAKEVRERVYVGGQSPPLCLVQPH